MRSNVNRDDEKTGSYAEGGGGSGAAVEVNPKPVPQWFDGW